MSAISVQAPFPTIPDVDGNPLEDGYIYIGTAGLPAEANPVTAYWDSALSITATQPIRTTGGYPVRSGSPAVIYVNGDYSIAVKNKNGSLVYQSLNNTQRVASPLDYTAGTYSLNDIVSYSGDWYVSLQNSNTALPSDATKWAPLPIPVRIQKATYVAAVAGGTADALTATFAPAITALPTAPETLFVMVRAASANATSTPTFSPNGLTAKTIVKGAGSALSGGDIAGAGHWIYLQYDGTLDKWVLLNPAGGVSAASAQVQPISASVAAGALTISASALSLDFRSTTLGSGTVTRVSGTPSDLVISSGSTLGTTSAVQSDLAVLALNNAGTIELAVVNLAGGVVLDEQGVISTTAEGGVGGADSASTVYSTTARASVAYRVIGLIRSTQATAGSWVTAPSLIQGNGGVSLVGMPKMLLSVAQATTSGTAIDFTGIPSWVKKITVMLNGVSTNGTSVLRLQLGAGSVTSTGYLGAANSLAQSQAVGGSQHSAGFDLSVFSQTAASLYFGSVTFSLIGSNTWACAGVVSQSASISSSVVSGAVPLSGVLDRLRLTTVNGTDTFDAGSVNILVEGY